MEEDLGAAGKGKQALEIRKTLGNWVFVGKKVGRKN